MSTTVIKEHPMLFSERLVKSILDGSKTQTRRPLKPQPDEDYEKLCGPEWYAPAVEGSDGEVRDGKPIFGVYSDDGEWGIALPYRVGDRLWVRESFEVVDGSGIEKGIRYLATSSGDDDWSYVEDTRPDHPTMRLGNWPSIHMPRWACRLVLEITNVRVQRAHQITDADVVAEGVERHQIEKYRKFFDKRDIHAMAFGELWNEHYGETELRWQCNPWIVAIDFRLAPTPEPH